MKVSRAQAIRQYLFAHGPSDIADIAEAVATSLPTLRRDLTELEESGVILREHGGARLADQVAGEVAFEQREAQAMPQKRAIAEAAFALIEPGSSIFLDSGTTALQLARRLRMGPMPLTVFTNCLPAAQLLVEAPGIKVTLLGGTLRRENASIVGPLAEDMIDRLWFSQLFLGAGAVSPDGWIMSADEGEARLNARMIARSDNRILLAHSGKFGQRLTYAVAPLSDLSLVISDKGLPDEVQDLMRDAEVQLKCVDLPVPVKKDKA